jgi:O-antigen ligase
VSTAKNIASSPYGLVWGSALHIAEAYPLFGVGIHQFRVVCPEERFGPLDNSATGYPRCYTHPHNAYLEWFSEEGIVGLLGFIAFVVVIARGVLVRLMSRESDLILWGLGAMLAVRLAPVFISTGFFNNWAAIPFWLALGWAMSYKAVSREPKLK